MAEINDIIAASLTEEQESNKAVEAFRKYAETVVRGQFTADEIESFSVEEVRDDSYALHLTLKSKPLMLCIIGSVKRGIDSASAYRLDAETKDIAEHYELEGGTLADVILAFTFITNK